MMQPPIKRSQKLSPSPNIVSLFLNLFLDNQPIIEPDSSKEVFKQLFSILVNQSDRSPFFHNQSHLNLAFDDRGGIGKSPFFKTVFNWKK